MRKYELCFDIKPQKVWKKKESDTDTILLLLMLFDRSFWRKLKVYVNTYTKEKPLR